MNAWRRYCELNREERLTLRRALVLMPLAAIALRLLGFRRLMALLGVGRPHAAVGWAEGTRVRCAGAARMVAAAARCGPVRASCLLQSIVLWHLLRREGIETALRIGTRKEEGAFEAHAWLELGGVPLGNPPDVRSRFSAFRQAILAAEVPEGSA